MSVVVKLIQLTMFCSCAQGSFNQASIDAITCQSNITVVFWCSNELPFLNFDIRGRSEQYQTSFNFNINDEVGATFTRMLLLSVVHAEVVYNNGSFINATVTVIRPQHLDGSSVTCNGDTLILNVSSDDVLPAVINITLNELTNLLDITWSSAESGYCLQVNSQFEANSTWTYVTASSYTLPPLENNTYIITISLAREIHRTSTFIIGPCLINDKYIQDRHYILAQNGTWTILQNCIGLSLHFNTLCGFSESWTTDIICPNNTETDYTTSNTGPHTTANCIVYVTPVGFSVIAVAVGIIASFIIALLTGLIIGVLGGVKYTQKKIMKTGSSNAIHESESEVCQSSNDPVYDEVKTKVAGSIDLLPNVAYGQVTRAN